MRKKQKYLFIDWNAGIFKIFSRFRTIFSIRTGIFTQIERTQLLYPEAELYFFHPNDVYQKNVCSQFSLSPISLFASKIFIKPSPSLTSVKEFLLERASIPMSCLLNSSNDWEEQSQYLENELMQEYTNVISSLNGPLNTNILENIGERIHKDLGIWLDNKNKKGTKFYKHDELKKWNCINGSTSKIFVPKNTQISQGVILDASDGEIVIDEEVEIAPFTYIKGPVFVGKAAQLFQLRLIGPSIIGQGSRISGEIENSIIGDFTNKQHAGFIGHSIIGNWVNLGAMTTNSDLKSNYGIVRLKLPSYNPKDKSQKKHVESSTDKIKWGALLGDWCKTSIGTLLQTGTVIDSGSNVFSPHEVPCVSSYLPPLSWGLDGENYDKNKFKEDSKKIALRRFQILPKEFDSYLKLL